MAGAFNNTARPLIVDTDALVDALKNRTIGGAAIDVYDDEPVTEYKEPVKKLNIH